MNNNKKNFTKKLSPLLPPYSDDDVIELITVNTYI